MPVLQIGGIFFHFIVSPEHSDTDQCNGDGGKPSRILMVMLLAL